MPVTPSNLFAANADKLADLLAHCATWQTLTSAADAAAAKAFITFNGQNEPEDGWAADRPQAYVLWPVEDLVTLTRQSIGAGPDLRLASGRLTLAIELPVLADEEFEVENPTTRFLNNIMQLISEMLTLIATGDYLWVRELTFDGYARAELDENEEVGDHHAAELTFVFGT